MCWPIKNNFKYLLNFADKENFKKKLIELLDNHCEPDMKLIFQKYRQDKDGIDDAVEKAFDVKRVKRAYNRLGK